MAADAARGYSKVLAFWFEALEGTATYEENGQKYLKYNGSRSIQGCRMDHGLRVQKAGAAAHWRVPRATPPDYDRGKLIEPEPD
jgi:hypothetical protein